MSKAETITKVYLSSKLKANQTILFPTESYRIGTSFVFLDRTITTPSLSFLHAQDPKIMKSSYSNKTIVRVLTHLTSNNPKNIMILIIEMIYFYWIIYKSSSICLLSGDFQMQPAIFFTILVIELQKLFYNQGGIYEFFVIKEEHWVLWCNCSFGVFDNILPHLLLLLTHWSFCVDQDSNLNQRYLHILSSTGLPACSMFKITGQYSGLICRKYTECCLRSSGVRAINAGYEMALR